MRIVCLSDTHERHRRVEVPDGDVLVHAGDITMLGDPAVLRDFDEWLGLLPHGRKIVIAGNHEMYWSEAKASLLTNAIYLQDSGCEIGGLKFWGSPYTPQFFDWAFMLPRGKSLYEHWLTIPHDTDVLITHGPPQGLLDSVTPDGEHCGDYDLGVVVEAIAPKLHVFGHIHGGYGQRKWGETIYVNASCVDEAYRPVNAPIVVDL